MRLHPGRILGIVMGLIILAAIFVLPFTSSQTFFAQVDPLFSSVAHVQLTTNPAIIASDYVLIIAFLLLLIAGLVGIFPLGTGVLGVLGLAMVATGPIFIYPSLGAPSYAIGYYVAWAASIVSLGASFWHARKRKVVNETTTVQSAQPPDELTHLLHSDKTI